MIRMWNNFGEYIYSLCDKNPTNIAEIGVGKFNQVYDFLNSKKNVNIVKIDINPSDDEVVKDDITKPNENLYKNLDIIYSIRPPSEIQPYLVNLKKINNAKLIIKPLFNEDLNISKIKMNLKNYKKASFYIM